MDLQDIIAIAGGKGLYQRKLMYGLLMPLYLLLPLFMLNMLFITSVPDHWCHVPGRQTTNYTLQQWKQHTLPKEIGPSGELRFSQCRMYDMNITLLDGELWISIQENRTLLAVENQKPGDVNMSLLAGKLQAPGNATNNASSRLHIIGCRHGWEYDRTDYSHTIATDYNWVCDKGTRSVAVLSFISIGYIISSMIFGPLADRLGRRIVFFFVTTILLVFRSLSLMVPNYYRVFVLLNILSSTAFPTMYHTIVTIVMEVSDKKLRAWITTIAFQGWVVGMCLLSLVAWLSRDWLILGIITTLPVIIFLLAWRLIPESPRWLVSQGKLEEAARIFSHIRKVNGKGAPYDFMTGLRTVDVSEKKYGVTSLFMYPKLAVKSILVTAAWAANTLVYSGTTMNIKNMGGNQFLNFFLLAIVEAPANFLSCWLVDRFGRRWIHVIFFFLTSFCFILNVATVTIPNLTWLEITLCLTAKICNCVTFVALYCQCVEIHPTCIRTTGLAVSSIISNGLATTAPFIIHLGTIHLSLPYIVMSCVSVMGGVLTSFIPETLNQPLPDTLEKAGSFWMTDKFWSWRITPARRGA